jgi:hypothetical protein
MPLITGDISTDGATIVVLVGVSRNRQLRLQSVNLPIPTSIPVTAQIDSGSFATGFLPEVFQQLGIQPFRILSVRTPSTKPGQPHRCPQHDVSVTLVTGSLDEQVELPSVHAIAADDFDREEGIQAIIGRDILDRCVFQYFGPSRRFRLSF